MPRQKKLKSRRGLFLAGMAALLVANLVHQTSRQEGALWVGTNDAIIGLFYGITIGLLLLSLRPPRAAA